MPSTLDAHKVKSNRNPTYRSYSSMKRRHKDRGVAVCERWLSSYECFLADMGSRPEGHTLDRKDNALGYLKENCRWATPKQQANNRTNNVILTHRGESLPLTAWAERVGMSPQTLFHRVRAGWAAADALERPLHREFSGNQWTS